MAPITLQLFDLHSYFVVKIVNLYRSCMLIGLYVS